MTTVALFSLASAIVERLLYAEQVDSINKTAQTIKRKRHTSFFRLITIIPPPNISDKFYAFYFKLMLFCLVSNNYAIWLIKWLLRSFPFSLDFVTAAYIWYTPGWRLRFFTVITPETNIYYKTVYPMKYSASMVFVLSTRFISIKNSLKFCR